MNRKVVGALQLLLVLAIIVGAFSLISGSVLTALVFVGAFIGIMSSCAFLLWLIGRVYENFSS